jgi:hypothetical protein
MSFHDRWPFHVNATTTTSGRYDSTYWSTYAGAVNQIEGMVAHRDDLRSIRLFQRGVIVHEVVIVSS